MSRPHFIHPTELPDQVNSIHAETDSLIEHICVAATVCLFKGHVMCVVGYRLVTAFAAGLWRV